MVRSAPAKSEVMKMRSVESPIWIVSGLGFSGAWARAGAAASSSGRTRANARLRDRIAQIPDKEESE